MAGLTAWLLVGGSMVVVLLDMALAAGLRSEVDARRAEELRALDSAIETAILQYQVDTTGRLGARAADGSCVDQPGGAEGYRYDDQLGNEVVVRSSCEGPDASGDGHLVQLSARLVDAGGGLVAAARIETTPVKGAGNRVTILGFETVPTPAAADPKAASAPR